MRGVCSMARTPDPNSANSQFFICFDDATFLDNQYTVWGEVTDGMENVDALPKGEPPRAPGKIVSMKVARGRSEAARSWLPRLKVFVTSDGLHRLCRGGEFAGQGAGRLGRCARTSSRRVRPTRPTTPLLVKAATGAAGGRPAHGRGRSAGNLAELEAGQAPGASPDPPRRSCKAGRRPGEPGSPTCRRDARTRHRPADARQRDAAPIAGPQGRGAHKGPEQAERERLEARLSAARRALG